MPKIRYEAKTFRGSSLRLIEVANGIIDEYAARGFSLTLRQLYYQMVARGVLPNRDKQYKRLGSIINGARLAGLVDWDAIVDRTRNIRHNTHWDSPKSIVDAAIRGYQIDKWENQSHRIEVWVEKDALIGVVESACRPLDVAFFSCRGYTSASEMWAAGQRFADHAYFDRQTPVVIHLGDHDPSGIDMTRDIRERLALFSGVDVEVRRIALNMEQVEQYGPPPNPTKLTDSRAQGYIYEFGDDSWELDALEPAVLVELITEAVLSFRDEDAWDEEQEIERGHIAALQKAADNMNLK